MSVVEIVRVIAGTLSSATCCLLCTSEICTNKKSQLVTETRVAFVATELQKVLGVKNRGTQCALHFLFLLTDCSDLTMSVKRVQHIFQYISRETSHTYLIIMLFYWKLHCTVDYDGLECLQTHSDIFSTFLLFFVITQDDGRVSHVNLGYS